MVLLGGAMYGTMSSFVKLSYSWGYNAAETSFSQAALAAIFLSICILKAKPNKSKLTRKGILSLLLTGSTIGLTNYLYYLSVNYIPASLAIVILMQFTWFSLLLEWLFFSKKPSKIEFITVIFILIGTIFAGNLLGIDSFSFSLNGVLLALLSSLTYAIYIVANSRIAKDTSWQLKSTLIMLGSAITIFMINGKAIIAENHFGTVFFLWSIFLAVVGTTIPTALFAVGISKVGAAISSILMTIELPVAILCAYIILGEHIQSSQLLGIIIMLVAISTMNYYKSIKTKKK